MAWPKKYIQFGTARLIDSETMAFLTLFCLTQNVDIYPQCFTNAPIIDATLKIAPVYSFKN